MTKTILDIDEPSSVQQLIKEALKTAGYEMVEGVDCKDAMVKLNGRVIQLVISDFRPAMMGRISLVIKKPYLSDPS
ncbi:MAG: hypothetical protein QX197_17020 [Methylococcaceae bacterium]